MIIQSVRSDNGGREGKWIALLIFLTAASAALLLPFHQAGSTQQELAEHQVSIKDLAQLELAMVADLRLAHEEIRNLYQERIDSGLQGQWADIAALEEMWLAPFISDKSWERQGQHAWHKIAPASYQGVPAVSSGSAAVLLNSALPEPDIWLDLNWQGQTFPELRQVSNSTAASAGFPAKQLIKAGWQQVVFAEQH